jgi:TolB-like protein
VRASKRRTLWALAVGAVAVGAIAAGAVAVYVRVGRHPADDDRSVAVLPFTSLSPSGDDAWFADGINEDLLTQLTKIGDLRVISRSSVLQYRHGPRNIREIGAALGVASVLEASVQRSGQRIRIEAQLVDARSDKEIWAERYDRDLTDVFAIQSAVAEEIAQALHARLSPSERQRLERKPTESTEAYEFYLRGMEYAYQRDASLQNWQIAEQMFRRAIEIDPSFALAHARLGLQNGILYWGCDTCRRARCDPRT